MWEPAREGARIGTDHSASVAIDRSHALRGNAARDAPRPLHSWNAERHLRHSFAARGNDHGGRQFSTLVGVGMNIHGLFLTLIDRQINVRQSHAGQRLLPTVTSY